jgi:putative endonuclease
MMAFREYHFYVYILSGRSRNLYVGFANNIFTPTTSRKAPGAYITRCNIDRLVYYEHFRYVLSAIARGLKIEDWSREKKLALIEDSTPPGRIWQRSGVGVRRMGDVPAVC